MVRLHSLKPNFIDDPPVSVWFDKLEKWLQMVLNIFRLFVILSLTQLYRYTPRYFSFRLSHLNISTSSDKLDKNSQRKWLIKNFIQ